MLKYKMLRLTLFVLASISLSLTAQEQKPKITILFTGDTGGRLKEDYQGRGGVAKRAYMVDKIREEEKNVILVDVGDFLSPDYISIKSEGKAAVHFLDELKYTMVTIGNHELDFGVDKLRERIEQLQKSGIAVVTSNIVTADNQPLGQPYILKTVMVDSQTVTILFLGVLDNDGLPKGVLENKLKVLPPLASIGQQLKALRDTKIDLVVCLGHISQNKAVKMAGEFPRVNLILTLSDGYTPEIRVMENKFLTQHRSSTIVTASNGGIYLGSIGVSLPSPGSAPVLTVKELELDAQCPANDVMRQTVFLEDTQADYPITTLAPGDNNPDTLIAMVLKLLKEKTHAEIALLNGGMFNFHAFPLKDNTLTLNSIYEFIWASDNLVVMKLKYGELRKILNASTGRGPADREPWYLYSDGIDLTKGLINDKPIGENDLYTVVTNDFLANGGNDYAQFLNGIGRQDFFTEKGNYLVSVANGKKYDLRNDVIIPGLIEWQASRTLTITDLDKKPVWKFYVDNLSMALRKTWWNGPSMEYPAIANYPPQNFFHMETQLLTGIERVGAWGTWKNEMTAAYGKDRYPQLEVENPNDLTFTSRYQVPMLLRKPQVLQTLYPFAQIKYDSEINRKKGADHKELNGFYNLGLGLGFLNFKDIRFMIGAAKDHSVDTGKVALSVGFNSLYQQRLKLKTVIEFVNQVTYEGKLGADERAEHKVVILDYFDIPLVKSVFLHSEFNIYGYQNSDIKRWAQAADYKISLVYKFNYKQQCF
jgi:5'-nucleotidase